MKKTIAMILMLCLVQAALCAGAFADGGYRIKAVDPDGNPVQGVMVQFCSDDQCLMGKTGEDGIAAFDMPAGSYTVHLLKVPAGYEKDTTEYPVPAAPDLVVLTVRPEGAAAAESEAAEAEAEVIDVPQLGLHFETPEALRNMKGQFSWNYDFADDGLLVISVSYLAVSKADNDAYKAFYKSVIEAYSSGKEPPVDSDHPSWASGYDEAPLYNIYVINGGRGENELRELLLKNYGLGDETFTALTEIGSDGDCRFFYNQYAPEIDSVDEYKPMIGEFYDEFETLLKDPAPYLSGLKLSAPEWPKVKKVGETLSFKTSDLEGNTVDSAELFSKAKVTMVNCWATWCGPCKAELPELGTMAKELEAQGCQLVGLCTDAMDDETVATAKQLLGDAGAAYLNLCCTDEIEEDLSLQAFPTTFFVDSEGKLLAVPFEGASPETYRTMLADCLAQLG